MFHIFGLYSDVKLAQMLVHFRYTLVHVSQSQNPPLNSTQLASQKATLHSIYKTLESVKKAGKKWTFDNIFKNLKETCFSPSREEFPNINQGAEKIASHFQVSKEL